MQESPNKRHLLELNSLEQTAALAKSLALHFEPGQFVALCGDLGAGKTTLSRFLTTELACKTLATSPTFSLFQEYEGGRVPVFHADLYRLGSADELFDLGWEEHLERFEQGLILVEWADKFPDFWPDDTLVLNCQYGVTDEQRCVEVTAFGSRSTRLLEKLQEEWGPS